MFTKAEDGGELMVLKNFVDQELSQPLVMFVSQWPLTYFENIAPGSMMELINQLQNHSLRYFCFNLAPVLLTMKYASEKGVKVYHVCLHYSQTRG